MYAVSSILPIDRALSGATTPSQSELGSDGNEGVLRIPQSSSTAGTPPSDCLVSYAGHSLGGGSYPSAEKQSVYSIAPADWAITSMVVFEVLWWPSEEMDTVTRVQILDKSVCISHIANTLGKDMNSINLPIIIIMSRCQHEYPWPFFATLPYRPLLPAGLQGYILYRHRAAVCRF